MQSPLLDDSALVLVNIGTKANPLFVIETKLPHADLTRFRFTVILLHLDISPLFYRSQTYYILERNNGLSSTLIGIKEKQTILRFCVTLFEIDECFLFLFIVSYFLAILHNLELGI